jgi:hypothetical protein
MKCRVYETDCINDRFCRAREACCAGDMSCVPLSVDELSAALDEVCKIALEWIALGIPDDDTRQIRSRVQSLLAFGTARQCTCPEGKETQCEVHPG